MSDFHELGFRRKVDAAMTKVQAVLDRTRNPVHPASVPHTYSDKYTLADSAGRTAVAAHMNIFALLGLDDEKLACLLGWFRAKRTVTLKFSRSDTCQHSRTAEREEDSSVKQVTESKSSVFGNSKTTHKTVVQIIEHFWRGFLCVLHFP